MSSSKSSASFFDLIGDDLRIKILEHLKDAAAIVRCGSLDRRFNALYRNICRLETTITTGKKENFFSSFLRLFSEQGGRLKHVSVQVFPPMRNVQVFPPMRNGRLNHSGSIPACLGWIRYICSPSLETLRLDLCCHFNNADIMLSDIARCSNLVSLRLYTIFSHDLRSCEHLVAKAVASCRMLKDLQLYVTFSKEFFMDSFSGDSSERLELELVNQSLQHVDLQVGSMTSVTLETPSLTALEISGGQLRLRSHALKKLVVANPSEEGMKFQTDCPLVNLELLVFDCRFPDGANVSLPSDVLRSFSSGSLDKLQLDFYHHLGRSLAMLLQPLTRLRSLVMGLQAVEVFGRTPTMFDEFKMTLERLGVAEIVVNVNKTGVECDHANTLLLLRSFISCSSLQKMVLDYSSLLPVGSGFVTSSGDAEALIRLLEALQEECPGKVRCKTIRF